MTEFIDLLYCSGLNGGQVLACAPMSADIKNGDIVCIDRMTGFYMVINHVTVVKDSDVYKFITEAFSDKYSNLYKVTDKFSHQEINRPLFSSGNGGSENE